ncbi:MAG: bifunctional metallophosphatase/5'-nucleotidase [Selenomonadaceae bacterium]|nr:bifunctional metallophosphatase/5'-nucleotidase [Selenomonadaceae bacterium]
MRCKVSVPVRRMTAWLMLCFWLAVAPSLAECAAKETNIVIFHTNDMHARVTTDEDRGESIGLAEMAAAVAAEKKQNKATLWLDAGDTLHGMPRINISQGENMVALLNLAGLNALAPGNHDFNYGAGQLVKLSRQMKFPLLCANVTYKKDNRLLFKPYKIFNLNGVKVGVFGLATPDTAVMTNPTKIDTINFLEPVQIAREMVKELRPKCDIVIGLMHMGLDKSSLVTSEEIARKVSGIDLIVDGHSHTTLPEGLTVGDTLIVQTGWHEYKLGRVNLKWQGGKIVAKEARLIDETELKGLIPEPDKAVATKLAAIDKTNEKLFSQKVATSDRDFDASFEGIRRRETELGNLCADAFRWRSQADIAVVNGGGIRGGFSRGDITTGDVMALFPFGNNLSLAQITGKQVKDALEYSVSRYPEMFGGFLQVSGLTFDYDPTKPVGERVQRVQVGESPLEDDKVYTFATLDYLFEGGDGYDMLKELKILKEFETCEDVIADYLKEVGTENITTGRINIKVEMPSAADSAADYNEAA